MLSKPLISTSSGPDSLRTETRNVQLDSQIRLHLTFVSSVLALRGNHVAVQPLVDEGTGNILCWNGQVRRCLLSHHSMPMRRIRIDPGWLECRIGAERYRDLVSCAERQDRTRTAISSEKCGRTRREYLREHRRTVSIISIIGDKRLMNLWEVPDTRLFTSMLVCNLRNTL